MDADFALDLEVLSTEQGQHFTNGRFTAALVPVGDAGLGGRLETKLWPDGYLPVSEAALQLGRRMPPAPGLHWLRLSHPRASGTHARIERRDGGCWPAVFW